MEKSKKPIRECLLYEYQLGNNAVIATQNKWLKPGQRANQAPNPGLHLLKGCLPCGGV